MRKLTNRVSLREYKFLQFYINIGSDTFGNAYKSALKAGYSHAYSRVIKRYFTPGRMQWIKYILKKDDLVKMIKTLQHVEVEPPSSDPREIYPPSPRKIREITRRNEREAGLTPLKNIIKELEELF